MGKVKIKKQSIWIDMTPMSDVMVLLLTFFMLTSTFIKNEAVKVNTPGAVSEEKVPEGDVLTILVEKGGKVFVGMDKPADMRGMVEKFAQREGINLSGEQLAIAQAATNIGVPANKLKELLSLEENALNNYQKEMGIPVDSAKIETKDNELQKWVDAAKAWNKEKYQDKTEDEKKEGRMKIAIKADSDTPYSDVKNVMASLQRIKQNRYFLITSYKKVEE